MVIQNYKCHKDNIKEHAKIEASNNQSHYLKVKVIISILLIILPLMALCLPFAVIGNKYIKNQHNFVHYI